MNQLHAETSYIDLRFRDSVLLKTGGFGCATSHLHFLAAHLCIHEKFHFMARKDVGLRIRVEKELREVFQGACVTKNRGPSEVLRAFMQAFVEQRHDGHQPDLFSAQASPSPR